jgi:hypothetical protein
MAALRLVVASLDHFQAWILPWKELDLGTRGTLVVMERKRKHRVEIE